MSHIPVLVGTTREGRRSIIVARLVMERIAALGHTTALLEPDQPPIVERRSHQDPVPDELEAFGQALEAADALVIVTPEYNWGIPGALKNSLDLVRGELRRKPVGLVGVSAGGGGGRIAVGQLWTTLTAMGAAPVGNPTLIGNVNSLIEDETIPSADTARFIDLMLEEVLWWEHAVRLKNAAGG